MQASVGTVCQFRLCLSSGIYLLLIRINYIFCVASHNTAMWFVLLETSVRPSSYLVACIYGYKFHRSTSNDGPDISEIPEEGTLLGIQSPQDKSVTHGQKKWRAEILVNGFHWMFVNGRYGDDVVEGRTSDLWCVCYVWMPLRGIESSILISPRAVSKVHEWWYWW